jgi:hypothetical protein
MNKHSKRQASPRLSTLRRRAATPGTVQYTVRNVPAHVDKAFRRKARNEQRSLNEVLRGALVKEAEGAEPSGHVYTDLDALAGTWVEDSGFDEAVQAQDRVDESLWR